MGRCTSSRRDQVRQWSTAPRWLSCSSRGRCAQSGRRDRCSVGPDRRRTRSVRPARRRTLSTPAAADGGRGTAPPHSRSHRRGPMRRRPTAELGCWLDNLAGALGDRLLRLKGLVNIRDEERPLLVQSVGTMFSAPRPFGGLVPPDGPFLVVIVRDLQASELDEIEPVGLFGPSPLRDFPPLRNAPRNATCRSFRGVPVNRLRSPRAKTL